MRMILSRSLICLAIAGGLLVADSLLVANAADTKSEKTTGIKPEAVKLGRPVDFQRERDHRQHGSLWCNIR